jgi:energy-coupling factor transporter transmembrane protein EcfT
MRTTATVAQWLVRITGLIQIVLGLLFWTGNQLTLVPVHMLVGLILVLSLWTLAFIGARSGIQPGFVVLAFLWGLLLPILGVTQAQILTGSAHWLIQVLHLLVGVAAIGQGEGLGQRIKQSAPAAA